MARETDVSRRLSDLLSTRVAAPALAWLDERCQAALSGARFHMAFSAVTRHFPRAPLALTAAERAALERDLPGVDVAHYQVDQLARTRLLLSLPERGPAALVAELDALCADADLQELIAVYQSLPLLPHPEALRARAAEGVRSNMQAVVEAVALHNPYPAAQLEDGPFFQMVLKCIFLGAPLHRIVGLDGRVTPELSRMLVDYARERRAAKRPVPHDLWRGVGPVADAATLPDVALTLERGDEVEKLAAVLSLRDNPHAAALLADQAARLERLGTFFDPWAELARMSAE